MSCTTALLRRLASSCAALLAALLALAPPAYAKITRIVIDQRLPLAVDATYETLTGRAFGELDPGDAHNALITDIQIAPRNTNGKVEYVASFVLVKPLDGTAFSGLMWHDVPNRGGRIIISSDLRAQRDV